MAAAAAVVLLAAASLAVCPAAAAPHAHSRGLVAADAPVAAADSLSSEQVSHKLDSQRATPLGEICSDYRTDGAFTCDIPTLPAKLNSANGVRAHPPFRLPTPPAHACGCSRGNYGDRLPDRAPAGVDGRPDHLTASSRITDRRPEPRR